MLALKPGVNAQGIRPELLLGLMVADGVYAKHGFDCVVTSLVDGKHSRTSLHYTGCGADLRTRNLPAGLAQVIADEINACLTDDYDVIVEADHIHMEYQPKR